jgi:thiol-disulfide isomerase/thioredoxin
VKKHWLIVTLSLVLSLPSWASSPPVFDIEIKTMDGSTTTVNQLLKTGPVYLKFWASWCKDCIQQMPHFQQTHDKYQGKLSVVALNIWNNESIDEIQKVKDRFNLSMPMGIDYSGELTKAFNFVGTPYHLLIDSQGSVVYSGYEANAKLDEKIAFTTTGELHSGSKNTDGFVTLFEEPPGELDKNINALIASDRVTALLFVATFCDYYLEDTRPKMSKNCIDVQNWVNESAKNNPDIQCHTIASRLWTGDKELASYVKKYNIAMPAAVDTSNTLFKQFAITEFPTLVFFRGGKELKRLTQLKTQAELNSLPTKPH